MSSDSDSDSETDEDSEEEEVSEVEDVDDQAADDAQFQLQLMQMQQLRQQQQLGQAGLNTGLGYGRRAQLGGGSAAARIQAARTAKQLAALGLDPTGAKKGKKDKKSAKKKRASKLDFHRVDQLWDSTIHNYKLTDTAEDEESSEYDQYLFNVRRTFDWEGKYKVSSDDVEIRILLTKDRLRSLTSRVSFSRRLSTMSWTVSRVSAWSKRHHKSTQISSFYTWRIFE